MTARKPPESHPYRFAWERARYPLVYLMDRPSEAAVQATILEGLAYLGIPAWANDAGAKTLRGRAAGALRRAGVSTAALKGRTGAGMAGLADIQGAIPATVHRFPFEWAIPLYVEVKRPEWMELDGKQFGPAGKPEPAQLAFLDTMHAAGAAVTVAWAWRDVEDLLRAILPP